MSHYLHRLGLVVSLVVLVPVAAGAQIPNLKKLKELKDKSKEVKKATDGQRPADSTARADSAPAVTPKPAAAAPVGAPATASPKVWENYDFVPGNKIMFYTDFSEDRVGNFARGLKHRSGSAEIVERDGVKMLRATDQAEFLIPLGRKLPQMFTIEFDLIPPPVYQGGTLVYVEGGAEMDRGDGSAEVNWNVAHQSIIGGGQDFSRSQKHLPEADYEPLMGKLTHVRILMDSGYFKLYANEKRLYNIPDLAFKRDTVLRVGLKGGEGEEVVFVTGIRVAESETDVMYDALLKKGRWVSQGILFATGKAEVQPESRPVLKEIASTMQKYADLKILIEGHTDNVGAAAANLALSDQRAAAVKAALVAQFGLDGARITTKGLGDTKPVAPNTTALGRAQNRRVEIVKQ